MKLIEIWKRLGKQPLKVTQHKEAIVFVDGEEYVISNVIYDSGKFIGFEAKSKSKYKWFNEAKKPKEHEWVIVKDKKGREYDNHQWVGHAWYKFIINDDNTCDGWRTNVDNIVSWRYQY